MNVLAIRLAVCALVGLLVTPAGADDWPVYQQNNQRNAKTIEALAAENLERVWTRQLPGPANPAWSGPAKWDAYAGIRGLKSMRNYDPAYHVIAVGDGVWLGSSTDDAVHCLNMSDGTTRWLYHTDGPIRVAPSFARGPAFPEGYVYFGSDDGYAYCVTAETGELRWRFSPQPSERRIVNNGRLVSMWPVRTGVLIDGDRAFFGASMLPWQQSYLCAVDAATGARDGVGQFVMQVDGATMEGPLAVVPGKLLVVPQGRVAPRLFSLDDGRSLGQLQGGGGSFVVLTHDSVFHGPGNKTGWLTASSVESLETVASFKRGNAMVVAGDASFILTDNALSASNYVTREQIWSVDCDCPLSLILANDTLFAGGQDRVRAFDARSGRMIWSHPVDGKAYGLCVASGHLMVSTDTGQVSAFAAPVDRPAAPSPALELASAPREEADRSGLQAVEMERDPTMKDRWVFQFPYAEGRRVTNLAGGPPLLTPQSLPLSRVAQQQAISFARLNNSLVVTDRLAEAEMPDEQLSAVAWVRIDEPIRWGGIVGCLQDNGDYERGWILGYEDDKFSFGLCGQQGKDPGLTFLAAPTAFQRGAWHHVAGVYDGKNMRLYVDGREVAHTAAQSGPINYPPKGVYVVGAHQDENEQYMMDGLIHEVRLYRRALSGQDIEQQYRRLAAAFPQATPADPSKDGNARLAVGPWLRFESPDVAVVRYRTADRAPTQLILYLDGEIAERAMTEPGTDHEVRLEQLRHDRQYSYQIEFKQADRMLRTPEYECDTFFNFSVPSFKPTAQLNSEETAESSTENVIRRVAEVVARAGAEPGLCLLLGIHDEQFVEQLIRASQWRVIAFDQDRKRMATLRERLQRCGMYGVRATTHHVSSIAQLPVTSRVANVIVCETLADGEPSAELLGELRRLLSPRGVGLLRGASAGQGELPSDVRDTSRLSENGDWLIVEGEPIAGSGEWSHIYGSAANNHYGGEALSESRTAQDLVVQWIGRPGPRYQADRNGRKPPPLATGGRIFLQGLHRILALDQYNGTVLWSLEIPALDRYNMPRDCGNWCADQHAVYLAVHGQCWQVSAVDGQLLNVFDAPTANGEDDRYDWGYVAREEDLLLGSCVRQGNVWKEFWGREAWYDTEAGPAANKVCSDVLFARDLTSDQSRWTYEQGAIVNSTITVGDGTVYFVQSRGEHLRQPSRRLGGDAFWQNQYLVALDARTGRLCWERSLDTEDGTSAFYLAYGDGRLVVVSSAKRQYFVYAYHAKTGKDLWDTRIPWAKGKADHGSHLSRPAIVGQRLFVRPAVLDLATGQKMPGEIPVGGCGTYACSDRALFFRAGSGKNSAMWTIDSGEYTMWDRLRPDCWLSTIPAGGMLLSPEGGGGCSCGSWMETSVGFLPAKALTVESDLSGP